MRGLEFLGFATDCRIVARLTLIDERQSVAKPRNSNPRMTRRYGPRTTRFSG